MKTTENISLAGYAFIIETDAYNELGEYIEDIRTSFSGDSSADEITADIEERIAELLCERCKEGMVVNITMVRDIKKRIGDPRELAEEDGTTEKTATHQDESKDEKKWWANKKIYRDIDERVLGGVCSGLGAYFGLDKVIFRIVFLILFFIGFSDEGLFCIPMILYICLWIAMPAARTVEQKCRMKGKPINLEGFRSKEFDLNKEVKEVVQSPAGRTIKRTCEVFIGLILLLAGLTGLLGSIVIPSIPAIIDCVMDSHYLQQTEEFIIFNSTIITNPVFWRLILASFALGFIGMLYGGIMLTFDLKAPSWKPGLVIFITWLISLFVMAAWVIKMIADALPGILI